MQFYNNHYAEMDYNVIPEDTYGLSLSHRLLTDDRLADMRRPRLVHFYVNGDVYYKGTKLSVTPNRYLNFQELLSDLEKILKPNISLPMGVRKIFTRKGRQIYSIEELCDGEAYVAAGPEPFKPLIYSSKPKLNTKSRNINKLRSFNTDQFRNHRASHSDNNIKSMAYKPKVITVIKNSMKKQIAIRVILNKSSLKSIEQLVTSLNESFTKLNNSEKPITKLFTISGKSIETVEDLLRPDEIFIAMDNAGLKWKDVSEIISDVFKDDYEKIKIYLQRWEINQKLLSGNSKKENIKIKSNHENNKVPESIFSDKETSKLKVEEEKPKEKEKKITFQKSQSFDEGQSVSNLKKESVFYEMPDDSSDELLIPIGKDAFSTSHMRDIMKAEMRTRRHLESTRKAIIDREKARYNRRRMHYVDLSGLGVENVADNDEMTPIRISNSSLSNHRYYPLLSNRSDYFDQYSQYMCSNITPYRMRPPLIQPTLSNESVYSPHPSIECGKLLKQRPRRLDTSQDLEKYRRIYADNSDSDSEDDRRELPSKDESRVGKIPELESLRQFQEIFQILSQIGKGQFCRVFHGRSASESETEEVALKIISKAALKGREFLIDKEIETQLRCRHEMVVNLLHQYETPNEIIMVLELAVNGDLLTILETYGPLSELQSSCVVLKLATTLQFLQIQNVVHRNICLENILVKSISHHNVDILLADFSYACKVTVPLRGIAGSPLFASPEMLKDIEYRYEVDMWSLGILTYMILTSTHPFIEGSINRTQLFTNIINNQYDYLTPFWKSIMREAKELIDGLLNPKVSKRLTVIDILCHPWILLEGTSANLCGRDIQAMQKLRREEIEYDIKKLQDDSTISSKSTKKEISKKNEQKIKVQNPNDGKPSRSLFGFFKGMKRDESKISLERKVK